MDPYQELGVPRDASSEDVKRAYRSKRSGAHPDKKKGGSSEKFHAIQKSYDILSDPDRRKRYDQTGDANAPTADPREVAMGEIASIFLGILDATDADHTNIVSLVKQHIQNAIREHNAKITQIKTSIGKRERALKCVSRKTPGNNFLEIVLRNDIISREQAVAQLKAKIEGCEVMVKMVDEYDYKSELARAPTMPMFTIGPTTGWQR